MGYRARSIAICTVLTGPIYAFLVFRIIRWGWLPFTFGMSVGLRLLISIIAGFVIAFVASVLILYLNPKSRAQAAIQTEYEKNGYSDRYIELLQAEVNRLSGKNDTSQIYLGYIRSLANAYLFHHDYQAAIETINLISPEVMMRKMGNYPGGGMQTVQYFGVQMAICESLKDPNRAEAVMRDAYPYIQANYGKSALGDIIIDEYYIMYYCIFGNYDQAFVYANHGMNRGDKPRFRLYGNVLYARVYMNMGDYDNADRYLDEASTYAKTNNEKRTVLMEKEEVKRKRNGEL